MSEAAGIVFNRRSMDKTIDYSNCRRTHSRTKHSLTHSLTHSHTQSLTSLKAYTRTCVARRRCSLFCTQTYTRSITPSSKQAIHRTGNNRAQQRFNRTKIAHAHSHDIKTKLRTVYESKIQIDNHHLTSPGRLEANASPSTSAKRMASNQSPVIFSSASGDITRPRTRISRDHCSGGMWGWRG